MDTNRAIHQHRGRSLFAQVDKSLEPLRVVGCGGVGLKIIRPVPWQCALFRRAFADSYHRFKFSHYKVERNQNIAAFTAPRKQQRPRIMRKLGPNSSERMATAAADAAPERIQPQRRRTRRRLRCIIIYNYYKYYSFRTYEINGDSLGV